MSRTNHSVSCALVWSVAGAACVIGAATISMAGDLSTPSTFKPKAAMSLGVGSKRVVGYFETVDRTCKLTLVVAEAIVGDDVPKYAPVRLSQSIPSGIAAKVIDTSEGQSLEVSCASDAASMQARALSEIAGYWRAKQ